MSEIFKLVAKLTLDTSEFDKNTEESKEKASVFADVLKADLAGRGISAAVDGLKNLAGAVKDFATDAVMSYGEVEQLKGGIETLFGDSAQKVLADADQAFRTAGMSAADYMDTSIQSAASLINSLGGDQEKAAELMNMSITDMADNVNKMGTNMDAVQNAYRGFSRGNFSMLDNLALGFSGTKEGMQDLLDKAEEISGFKYDISSYSDIVEAIHVVQDEMGITGTTAKEASGTIQGSIGAMKAAWENFTAGIADPDANLGDLITNLVDTSITALDNIVPVLGRTLSGAGMAIMRLAPVIMNKIPEIFNDLGPDLGDAALAMVEYIVDAFNENVPKLLEAGASLIQSIGEGLVEGIPQFLEMALPLIESFSETFREGAGNLVDLGIEFILNLAQGIMDSLPMLIEQVPQIIINFAGAINDNAPKVLVGGVKLILTIIQGIISAIPTLVANIPKIFQAVLAVWTALNWVNLGKNVIEFIKNGIDQLAQNVPQTLKDIGNKAIEWFKSVNWANAGQQAINFIRTAILAIATHIPQTVMDIASRAIAWFKSVDWASAGSKAIEYIKTAIANIATHIPQTIKDIASDAIEWFKGVDWAGAGSAVIGFIKDSITGLATDIPYALWDIAEQAWDWFNDVDWFSLGSNIIDGIVDGLQSGVRWITDAATSVAQKAKDAAENLLGIASPSKVFRDEVGKMIDKGLAIGIEQNAIDVIRSAEELSKNVLKPFDDLGAPVIGASADSGSMGAFSQEFGGYIAEVIQANNASLVEGIYEAMMMVMQDGGFTMQMDGREFGRVLRENGVAMA